jgi:hypothetical protein
MQTTPFIEEDKALLVRLIDNNGNLLNQGGTAIMGHGIYPHEGKIEVGHFPAGLDANGNIYCEVCGSGNEIMADNDDGMLDPKQWMMGKNYKHLLG